jgi:hypothetical protein
MRFYKNKQSEMLHTVAAFLKSEQNDVSAKVPALKEFIADFLEKEKQLEALKSWNPNAILTETLGKKVIRQPFTEVTMKLLSVAKAANYRSKSKQNEQKHYTLWDLKKLSAAELCKVYLAAEAKVKRIKNLSYYGLSPADLRDAKAYYKEFAVIKNAPARRKRAVAEKNKKLEDSVKECIELLEHTIDPLMLLATENNWKLKERYKSTRQVLPRAQGRMSDQEAAYRKSREPKKKEVR